MTTTTPQEVPYRGTVFYGRKINQEERGGFRYENEEAAVHVAFDVDPADEGATVMAARDAFGIAKAVVFTELGLPFEVDRETGVVREVIEVRQQQAKAAAKVKKTFGGGGNSKAGGGRQAGGGRAKAAVIKGACPDCGGDMFDNRESKSNPKAPDFRCTSHKDGCEGIVWPNQTEDFLAALVTEEEPF